MPVADISLDQSRTRSLSVFVLVAAIIPHKLLMQINGIVGTSDLPVIYLCVVFARHMHDRDDRAVTDYKAIRALFIRSWPK